MWEGELTLWTKSHIHLKGPAGVTTLIVMDCQVGIMEHSMQTYNFCYELFNLRWQRQNLKKKKKKENKHIYFLKT